MRIRASLPTFALFCFSSALTAEGEKHIASKITEAKVFLSGAQVSRSASATVPSDTSTLVFTGLAEGIDPQSIQVAGTEKAIAGFDRALITTLRTSMEENDLRGLSKLFNLDLLKLPVEKGGVEVKKKK